MSWFLNEGSMSKTLSVFGKPYDEIQVIRERKLMPCKTLQPKLVRLTTL